MIDRLRERVGLYRANEVPDAQGGHARDWQLAFAAWAGVEPLGTATEPESGRDLRRYRVTLRHRTDIPDPARIRWRGRTLAVRASDDPDLRRERLHLICEDL